MNDQGDFFDDGSGKSRRATGAKQVLDSTGPWKERALAYIYALPRGWEGYGEDIRFYAAPLVGEPHDPNHAWSAIVLAAATHGWLVPTGRHRKAMRRKESNHRDVKEWRRT